MRSSAVRWLGRHGASGRACGDRCADGIPEGDPQAQAMSPRCGKVSTAWLAEEQCPDRLSLGYGGPDRLHLARPSA